MDTHTLPRAATVADVAPWLLAGNVTIHCYRCKCGFRLKPDDQLEANGAKLCPPCEVAEDAWHADMNAAPDWSSSDDRAAGVPRWMLEAAS